MCTIEAYEAFEIIRSYDCRFMIPYTSVFHKTCAIRDLFHISIEGALRVLLICSVGFYVGTYTTKGYGGSAAIFLKPLC